MSILADVSIRSTEKPAQRPRRRLTDLRSELAEQLALSIESQHISLATAASRIGTDPTTLSKVLQGELTGSLDQLGSWLEAIEPAQNLLPDVEVLGPDYRQMRVIHRTCQISVWERDLVTGKTYWSAESYDLYGWPRDQAPPDYATWLNLIHPDDRDAVAATRASLSAAYKRCESEFRIVRPDGDVRWLLNRAVADLDADGRPLRVYGANIDITKGRRTEAALRDQEALLRLVARVGRVGYFIWDPQRGLATTSDQYRLLYGLPDDCRELTFERWIELIHPDDRERVLLEIEKATENGALVENEHRILRADTGETRWVLNRSEILRDAAGNILRVVGAQFDITDQKHAEAEARASEQRLRVAQRATHAVTWEHDLVTGKTTWSDVETLRDIAGIEVGAATRLSDWVALIHDEDKASYFTQWAKCLEAGEGRVEFRIDRNAQIRTVELFGKVVARDAGGSPSKLIGIATDVTRSRELADNLEESEQRLRIAIEAGRMAVFDHDLSTDRFSHSAELNRMLGLPPGNLSIAQIRTHYAPGEMARLQAHRSAAIAQGDRFLDTEFQMVTATGERRWFLMRAETRTGRRGKAYGTSGVLLDIDDRKRAEQHQRMLVDELNHRTKNQLQVVQAIARQTLRGPGIDAAHLRAFEGRLGALAAAHDLLTSQKWESVPLGRLIGGTIEAVGAHGRVEMEGPPVLLHPRPGVSIAMAMHELATNAVKHGSLSNKAGRVTVRWAMTDDRLRLVWRETGGPTVAPPQRRGFGSRMIEQGLAAELGGKIRIDFDPRGVVCTIDAPKPDPTP